MSAAKTGSVDTDIAVETAELIREQIIPQASITELVQVSEGPQTVFRSLGE